MKKLLYFLVVLLIILAGLVTFYSPNTTLISPLGIPQINVTKNIDQTKYVILGFAPYWNMKKLTLDSTSHITHLAYFNLHLKSDGSLFKRVNSREEDPGFTNYKRLLNKTFTISPKPLILTFMPESQDALIAMISSSTLRAQTIKTIRELVNESGAVGINIDFEPLGDIASSTKNNFTLFINELRSMLDELDEPEKLLTVSTYASAAVRPRIWDLEALSNHVDYFVIMTYDYTMPASLSSGPNSPLRGSGDLFEHDIVKNISEITKLVPSSKILLGIPFYGYEWDTVDSSKYSPTDSKGSMASLERVQQLLDDKTLELVWDRNSLTPYGISTSSGQVSQIYFENETSIRLKIEFVKSASLGGIAIWALGYEGNNSWVWPTINRLSQ